VLWWVVSGALGVVWGMCAMQDHWLSILVRLAIHAVPATQCPTACVKLLDLLLPITKVPHMVLGILSTGYWQKDNTDNLSFESTL
jgi:hypothetical protein